MVIYLFIFVSSSIFAALADSKKNKYKVYIYSCISILLPAILAGMRSSNIGTDINGYVVDNFNVALWAEPFSKYVGLIYGKEKLYLLLVYCTAKIFHNIQWTLFFIELITVSCIYIGAYRIKYRPSMGWIMITYYLLFYNESLNIVRQSMSVAILFLGTKELFEKKYLKYFLLVTVATFIHSTAMFGIILFAIYYYLEIDKKNEKMQLLKKMFFIIGALLIVYLFEGICVFLIAKGILESRYMAYFTLNSVSNSNALNILYIFLLFIIILGHKTLKKKIYKFDFWELIFIFSFILMQLGRVIYFGSRFSNLFCLYSIVLIPQLQTIFTSKKNKVLFQIMLSICVMIYWAYTFIYRNVGETYPYVPFWKI